MLKKNNGGCVSCRVYTHHRMFVFKNKDGRRRLLKNPVAIKGKERLSFAGATLNKPTKASFRIFLKQNVSNVHVTLKRVACHMLSLLSIKKFADRDKNQVRFS